jgi:hypothetical protein
MPNVHGNINRQSRMELGLRIVLGLCSTCGRDVGDHVKTYFFGRSPDVVLVRRYPRQGNGCTNRPWRWQKIQKNWPGGHPGAPTRTPLGDPFAGLVIGGATMIRHANPTQPVGALAQTMTDSPSLPSFGTVRWRRVFACGALVVAGGTAVALSTVTEAADPK